MYKLVLTTLIPILSLPVLGEEIEPVHYAYANYLGSGIYHTTGQNASIVNLPFSYEIDKEGQLTYGLRLPISFGFFDFELADIPELDFPSEVGTLTFTPGIEASYRYSNDLVLESYIDFGYAKNLTTQKNVSVHSVGISSMYYFNIEDYDSIWVNRLYYAGYDGNGFDAQDSYAAFHLGIDTGLPLKYQVFGYQFQPRIFATAFWYYKEVDFPILSTQAFDDKNNVTLTDSYELGFTMKFDETIGYSWAGIDRLGLSYRFSEQFSAFRLLFSFPI
jgi:hypothetical protein